MLKKLLLGMLMILNGLKVHAAPSSYIRNFFYSSHCAGAEYYTLSKKSSARDISFLKETHLYTNTLLVHLLFPFYFALSCSDKMSNLKEQHLEFYGKSFGKIAHESFIVPILGAIVLAYTSYFVAKKIINLIKS